MQAAGPLWLLALVLLLAAPALHLLRFRRWYRRATNGTAYFGLPAAGREARKREVGGGAGW